MHKGLLLLAFCVVCFACAEEKSVVVEFNNLCDKSYESKKIETTGYLGLDSSFRCSSLNGSVMTCNLRFTDKPLETPENAKDDESYHAYIEKGKGNNAVDDPGGSYKKENLKLRDNQGNEVGYRDKVKITAAAHSSPNPDGTFSKCTLNVSKIEKQ